MGILKTRAAAKALPAEMAAAATAAPPGAFRSAERQALAEAIEARNHLQRELDATTKALNNLDEAGGIRVAHKAVEAAKEAVETAKEHAAAFVTAKVRGTAGDPPVSISEARAALQAAEDDLDTALAVKAGLIKKKEIEEEALHWAKSRVKTKIEAVVSADRSLRKLFLEFEEMRRLMAQRAQLFRFLFAMTPHEFRNWQSIRQYRPAELQDETAPWRAALAELEHNSEAPLPS